MKNRRLQRRASSRKNRKSKLANKLLGYSAAASAALAGGQTAEAAINAKTNQNVMVLPGQTFDLDLNNDGTPDIRLGLLGGPGFSTTGGFGVGGTSTLANNGTMATLKFYNYSRYYRIASQSGNAYASNIGFGGQIATTGYARKLQSSTNVDANLLASGGSSFAALGFLSTNYNINVNNSSVRYYKQLLSTGGGVVTSYPHPTLSNRYGGYSTGPTSFFTSYGAFPGMRGFLGVQFNDVAANTRFAWVDVELEGDYSKLTVHGWAFETQPGVGIHAGSVPEPSGLALLATGAAGVLATRRTRLKKKQESNKN